MATHRKALWPNVVVVTSIGTEHNCSFGSLENTRAEKAKMLSGLGADEVAVLNGDDPHVMWMASTTRARVVTFGLSESNMVGLSPSIVNWPTARRLR